jgi:hypothetical protein
MANIPPTNNGAALGDMQTMMADMQAQSLAMQKLQMWHSNEMEKISGLAQANKGGDETKKQITQNFK